MPRSGMVALAAIARTLLAVLYYEWRPSKKLRRNGVEETKDWGEDERSI